MDSEIYIDANLEFGNQMQDMRFIERVLSDTQVTIMFNAFNGNSDLWSIHTTPVST